MTGLRIGNQQVADFVGTHAITDEQAGRIFANILQHSTTQEQIDELCDTLGIDQRKAIAWAREIVGMAEEEQDVPPGIVSVPNDRPCPACGSFAWRADMGIVDCQCCGYVCGHKYVSLVVSERDGLAAMTCSGCGCEVDR